MRIDGNTALAEARGVFETYQAMAPWELVISLDRDYPVKRPTLAQVAGLDGLMSGRSALGNAQALELLQSFFEPDSTPNLQDMDVVGVVVSSILLTWQEIAKKKPAMVAEAIGRQIKVSRPST